MSLQYAKMSDRIKAYIVDVLLLFAVNSLINAAVEFMAQKMGIKIPIVNQKTTHALEMLKNPVIITEYLCNILTSVFYFGLFQGYWGKTLGKHFFGLVVVKSNGEKVGMALGIWRWAMSILSTLPLYAGYFLLYTNEKKRCLHDFLSGTLVVFEHSLAKTEKDTNLGETRHAA